MEDSNIRKGYQKIIYAESMKELEGLRYLIGIAFLLFAIYFMWNGIYIMAGLILLSGLIAMEKCSETIIDKEKMLLIRKVGVFVPFLKIKSKSINGTESVAVETFTTLQRRNKQRERTIKTRYRLNLNVAGNKIPVRVIFDKSQANAFAKEIAQLLEIQFVKL